MNAWALVLVVAVVIGALLAHRHLRRPVPAATAPTDVGPDPALDVALDAVFADAVDQRDVMIASRLERVVIRQVPVRRLEAVPELRTVRLCFADGTRLFGKGANPGDLGLLSMLVTRHHVWPARQCRDGSGNHLLLTVEGRREPVDVVITGLDQPE